MLWCFFKRRSFKKSEQIWIKPTCSKVETVKKCGRVKQNGSTKKLIPRAAFFPALCALCENPMHFNSNPPQSHPPPATHHASGGAQWARNGFPSVKVSREQPAGWNCVQPFAQIYSSEIKNIFHPSPRSSSQSCCDILSWCYSNTVHTETACYYTNPLNSPVRAPFYQSRTCHATTLLYLVLQVYKCFTLRWALTV